MERRLTAAPRRPAGARPLVAGLLVAGAAALAAGCYVRYPVPAGRVEDRTPGGPASPDAGWEGSGCVVTVRQEVLDRIAALRKERGLPALRPHPELARAAQGHTGDQAARDRVTHSGADGTVVADRVERAGYAYATVGENVAGGYPSPEAVVAAWLDSPGHRAILLSPDARHAGVGYAFRADGRLHHFWTLVVAAPGRTEATAPVACHP